MQHFKAIAVFAAMIGILSANGAQAGEAEEFFKRIIAQQQSGGLDGQPINVTFQSFKIGQPYSYRVPPAGYNSPDGPYGRPGTTVYPIETTYTIRKSYTTAFNYSKRPNQRFACFKDVQGNWRCTGNGGNFNWIYWSEPRSSAARVAPPVQAYPTRATGQASQPVATPMQASASSVRNSIAATLRYQLQRQGNSTVDNIQVGNPRLYTRNDFSGGVVGRTIVYPVTLDMTASGAYSNGSRFKKEFACFQPPNIQSWTCFFVRSLR
jgi:hypothetical protein